MKERLLKFKDYFINQQVLYFTCFILLFLLIPFFQLQAMGTNYSLSVQVSNINNNTVTNNIMFGVHYLTNIATDYFASATNDVVLVNYTYNTNDMDKISWGIRLYTYNSNYTGSSPYGGLINTNVNKRVPLLWRVYNNLQSQGVKCVSSDNWAYIKDKRDNNWEEESRIIYGIVQGTENKAELAPYPVSGRSNNFALPLYLYLAADCTGVFSGSNSYSTTLYFDLYHMLYVPPKVLITGLFPLQGYNTTRKIILDITGQEFKEGAIVKLVKQGQKDILANNVVVVLDRILADFDLTKAFKTGAWDVVVINPDEAITSLPEGFLIMGFDMAGNKLIPVNNLFNPALGEKVYIKYSITSQEKVSLKIYNVKGEIVKTILDNTFVSPGVNQYDWDGRNDGTKQISSGIYIVRIKAGSFEDAIKIVAVK